MTAATTPPRQDYVKEHEQERMECVHTEQLECDDVAARHETMQSKVND